MSDDVLSKYEGLTFNAETVEEMANEMAGSLVKILEQEPCPVVEIPPISEQSEEAVRDRRVEGIVFDPMPSKDSISASISPIALLDVNGGSDEN